MPVSFSFLRKLDDEFQAWDKRSRDNAPRNGIPVGGGEWMDSFFRAEAIAGVQRLLRQGRGLNEAIENGIRDGKEAIRIWNSRREWQVHRWDGWIESFLQETIRRVRSKL